jgi:hypothetical protein
MDPDDICPPWWPKIIWDLHFHRPIPGTKPNPVNYPPEIENIMSALAIHTFSYKMSDQNVAQQIRTMAEEQISSAARSMSKLHDEAKARTLGK